MEIKPNRTNWKLFCQEPPLTETEQKAWNEMASAIMQDDSPDDSLFDFIDKAVSECQLRALSQPSESWTDLVERADARRRLQRAEIRAYQEWKEKP